jgi:hypothetical protein
MYLESIDAVERPWEKLSVNLSVNMHPKLTKIDQIQLKLGKLKSKKSRNIPIFEEFRKPGVAFS